MLSLTHFDHQDTHLVYGLHAFAADGHALLTHYTTAAVDEGDGGTGEENDGSLLGVKSVCALVWLDRMRPWTQAGANLMIGCRAPRRHEVTHVHVHTHAYTHRLPLSPFLTHGYTYIYIHTH